MLVEFKVTIEVKGLTVLLQGHSHDYRNNTI